MFESLSDRLESVFKKLRGHGRLDEKNIQEGLREVRLALLEADVHFDVVRGFVDRVRQRALGQEVQGSLTPGQQVIKIVHEELIALLGGEHEGLAFAGKPPHAVMMVGLQGSGKTTSAAKLALFLRRRKMSPYLVPADVYRPAAIDQLRKLGAELGVPVFASTVEMNPVDICRQGLAEAARLGHSVVIFDTAGRLHVDEALMNELVAIKEACSPQEILFVADAMTGQDAVTVAQAFDAALDITGVVLTKMDGDARGGAALSIKSITGKPLKFVGTGERPSEFEVFYPDRIASRILGMGDVLTLIEKAQSTIDAKEAERIQDRMRKAEFDFEDFRTQMRRIRKLGSIEGLLALIPGMGKLRKQLQDVRLPDKEMAKVEAMINAMTVAERRNPKMIDVSRRQRIARGSGVTVADVNALIKNFEQMRGLMQQMLQGKMPTAPGGAAPGMPTMPGMPGLPGAGGGRRSAVDRDKLREKRKKERKQRKRK
ncbi:MAG TPA: signal recognition particle protein [Desulfomicrobiaceae bacterium]|jgi:signal recognition particle subunit SRP54|nr:signal recognition particle protein [Desulfomicrobiaceae bacterium]HCF06339.1 signal recognition particle protein [Desulfomicrobiaceae bacterium]